MSERRTYKIFMFLFLVGAIKYMVDPETDEVYAKLRLVPMNPNNTDYDRDVAVIVGSDTQQEKPASFDQTLTQSDANNGGGFFVPRYCVETIFLCLDYLAKPSIQNILAKDIHGET
ncbi:hypothetical protein RJT34_11760 [Clitoria ternatea]|uniref:Uncharacterized protein n=1 Tax=Clitoria ternatea TaxID=43366 RepID=A0AAN9JP66_CLITE